MLLEKMVVDWTTIYSYPDSLDYLTNCVIYISISNFNILKQKINADINSSSRGNREHIIKRYNSFIRFVKKHSKKLNEHVMQTDELIYNEKNNSYIVVVKDVKDVRLLSESLEDVYFEDYENETIFVAISEESQILTGSDLIMELIEENELPIFIVDIRKLNII